MKLIPGVQQDGTGANFVIFQGHGFEQRRVAYVPQEQLVYHGHSEGFSMVDMTDHFERVREVPWHETIEDRQTQADARRESKLRTIAELKRRGCIKTAAWLEARL